jgi:hypothetical protein
MAFIYVDSAAGGTPDGLTWNTAWLTLTDAVADANLVGGSTIFIDDGHSVTVADTVDLSFDDSSSMDTSDGVFFAVVDKASATALDNNTTGADGVSSTGAIEAVNNTAVNYISPNSSGRSRWYGMAFHGMWEFSVNSYGSVFFENCEFDFSYAIANAHFRGYNYANSITLKDCTFGFSHVDQYIGLIGGGYIEIDNMKFLTGTTLRNVFLQNMDSFGGKYTVKNTDISALVAASGASILKSTVNNASNQTKSEVKLSNCKVPTTSFSWIGTRNSYDNYLFEAYNCWSDDTNYHVVILSYLCDVSSDAANYLTATSDGTTNYSLFVESSSACNKAARFRFKVATVYAGANATFKLNMIHAGVGSGTSGDLTDAEIAMEVVYPDATYGTLGKRQSTRSVDTNEAPASGADYSNNTESWTEVLTGEVKQEMSTTLSDSQAGVHEVWVEVFGASLDVYIDPFVVIT